MLTQLRGQALTFWQKQSRGQRLLFIGLAGLLLTAAAVFVSWANTPSYAVAFSGLDEADAGQIVEQLANDNIPYRLENNSTILVPSDQVYEVRLSMARQGLPQGGTVGFELFSGTTLGMTDFTQRVNYQRALEGELERTIGSLNAVQAVRVHIVTPEKTLLTSEQAPTTASITLALKPGQAINAAQVQAITHLVASSVEGLQPEEVVIVDVEGNLLANGNTTGTAADLSASDSHRAAEAAFAANLESQVRNLLDTALGPNKSVVKASVALDWTQREITSQTFDPAGGVLRSAQTLTETYSGDGTALAGVPGATSNLPPLATGETVTDTASAAYLRVEHTTNYEITQEQSHEVIAPGQVERISLSVMVDGVTDTVQLDTLRTVVAAAAGIDPTRGDSLAVETLMFDRTYFEEQAAAMAEESQTQLYLQIGLAVAAALGALFLLWYVQRLLGNLRLASQEAWTPIMMPVAALGQPAAAISAMNPALAATAAPSSIVAPAAAPEPARPSPEEEQLQRSMAKIVQESPVTLAEVIHLWLSEEEKK